MFQELYEKNKGKFFPCPEEIYRPIDAINYSGLKDVLQSPMHYFERSLLKTEPTEAMRFGQLVHTAILEPEKFLSQYVVEPKFDKRTTVGKMNYAEWQQTIKPNSIVLKPEQADQLIGMIGSLNKNKDAANLLKKGVAETVGLWLDPDTEEPCKAKIDFLTDNGIMIDVKTTSDIREFDRSVHKYHYDLQCAFYMEGLKQIYGQIVTPMFLVIEKDPPYATVLFKHVDDLLIRSGQRKFRRALDLYHDCKLKNEWPGYSNDYLALPQWALDPSLVNEI